MFNKLDKLRWKNIVSPANESQAYSTILRALGLVEPSNKKILLPSSSTLWQDAFAEAMRSPYGSVIRQIIEGNILLTIMHEIIVAIQKEIEILEKELKALEAELAGTDEKENNSNHNKSHPNKEVILKEILSKKESLTGLQNLLDEHRDLQPYFTNQLFILNAKYISGIEKEIEKCKTRIIAEAKELGYEFNETEKAIINSTVPIEELRSKLLASYQQASSTNVRNTHVNNVKSIQSAATLSNFQIPAAPAPPAVNAPLEAPSGAYLAARRLPDLELRTLMALNAYWNREVNAMMTPSATTHTPDSTSHSVQEAHSQTRSGKRTELAALRAEFAAKYQEQAHLPVSERTVRFQPRDSDSRVIYSVQDSARLLKDFSATFHSLNDHAQALQELHEGEVKDVYDKMLAHIDKAKQQLNNPAEPANAAEPPKSSPSPSMAQS